MPGTGLGAGDAKLNSTKFLLPWGIRSSVGEVINNKKMELKDKVDIMEKADTHT